jgi:hypothetical protein
VRLDVIDGRGAALGTAQIDLADRAPRPGQPAIPREDAPPPLLGAWVPLLSLSPVLDTLWLPPTPPNAAAIGAGVARGERGWVAEGQARATGSIGPLGLDAALRTSAAGEPSFGSGGWLGARVRVLRLDRASLELAPALRAGIPLADAGPPARLEPSLSAGGAAGRLSWVIDAGARLRLSDGAGASGVPASHGFLLVGAAFEPAPWLRLHSVIDAHLLHAQPALVRGGVGAGAEAGGPLFGGLSVRMGPTHDAREGAIATQIVVGIREERR